MRPGIIAVLLLGSAPFHAPLYAQAARTRDSAGIRIVENPSRLTHAVNLRLAQIPVFDVGGLEANPDDEFNTRQGYLRGVALGNGGLAVIDVSRVHIFSPIAKRIGIFGRLGAGPGDFNYLTAVCRTRGDTILVGDQNNHRVAVLDRNGIIVRTNPTGDYGYSPFDFCFDDGTYLLEKSLPFTPGKERTMRLTRMRLDGSVANAIGDVSGGIFELVTQTEVVVVPAGQRLYYGTGLSSEVRVLNPSGKVLSIIRTDDPPIAITAAEVEHNYASTIPTNVTADDRAARMERMRSQAHADSWPSYGRAHVDSHGRLWLADYKIKYPGPDNWSVFDPSGRLIGRLVLPELPKGEYREVISFGDNNILVRRNDSDGAAHLTAYSILGLGPEHQ